MQIKEHIYNWLVGMHVIPNDGKKYADKVEIPKLSVQMLENGVAFGQLLKEVVKLRNRPMTPMSKLDSLKDSQQKASILYNWKIICEEYAKVGIQIDQETKALILGGDREMLHELLNEIHDECATWRGGGQLDDSQVSQYRNVNSTKIIASNKISQANQAVDLTKLDTKKDLSKTHNCLEFFIVALAKNLQLNTKQAASLFTNNNKYLAHILAKGVKGVFEPIVAFYKETYANANQLNKLFQEDQTKKSITFSLQALKAGMISKSFEVAYEAVRLFNKLAATLPMQQVREWFLEEQGGLYTALMGARRHPDLAPLQVELICQFGRYNFVEVFTQGLKSVLKETVDFVNSVELIYPPLSTNQELVSTGILNDWVTQAIGIADSEFKNSVDCRISALNFLTLVLNTQELDETLTNQVIALLKKGSRDKSQALALMCLNHLFKLLLHFGYMKSSYAPLVYKNLTLSLVETHDNQVIREFILGNFVQVFQTLESIPSSLLIENLIKQLQTSEGVTYILNTFDMQFFSFLTGLNIGIKNSIQLLDLLAKVFLNNIVYSSIASEIIVNILSKNIENQTMQDFILKFVKIALAMFFASEKKKQQGKDPIQAQKRSQIVELIRTIVQLQQQLLNDKIKPLVAHTNISIKQFAKKNSRGMMIILELFGNAERILEGYEVEFREQQARQVMSEDDEPLQLQQSSIHRMGKLTKDEQYSLASLKITKADPKVLENLETIKKNYVEKVATKVQRVDQEAQAQAKQKQNLRKQLEKRSIEQGISIKKNQEAVLIYADGSRSVSAPNKHGLTEYELWDLSTEEDRERLLSEQVFRKYHKCIKHMFFKYANSGHKINKPKDFDALQMMSDTINEPELWNLFKDYELVFQVTREQVHALLRSTAMQILKSKIELTNFNFDGFKILLQQYGIMYYNRKNKYISASNCLQRLIDHIRQVTATRGESTQLFDDPENMFFQQTEVIKEFNSKLQQDPKYPLPEGFKAIKEPVLKLAYTLQVDDGSRDVYEILDDILSNALNTHLIEPITSEDTQLLCRPNILGHVKSIVAERLSGSYIEPIKKQPQKQLSVSKSTKSIPKRTLEIEPFRQPTLGMRMGMAQIPFKDKGIAEQVSAVLDDMLYAIENGKTKLDRNQPIINKALKDKHSIEAKEMEDRIRKEEALKQHHEEVKKKLEALKKNRELVESKEKQANDAQLKKKQQAEEAKAQERKQYLKEIKDKAGDAQKVLEEARLRQELEEKNKRANELQRKKKKFQEFNQKQIDEFKAMFEAEKEKQKQADEGKKQKEESDEKVYQKLYQLIEKKGEKIKQKEKMTSDQIAKMFGGEPYQKVFQKYNTQLSYLFELLQLENYKSIENLEFKEIPLKIFMWFGDRFSIYPEVIELTDFIRVFNTITYKKPTIPLGLDYFEFLQALLRISIKGYQVFNKLAKKPQQQQPQQPVDEPQPPVQQMVKRTQQSQQFMKQAIVSEIKEQEKRLEEVKQQAQKQKKLEEEALLLDNYKGIQECNEQTLEALIVYLALPTDKIGMELRFRYLIEQGGVKQSIKTRKQEVNAKLEEDYKDWKEVQAIEQRRSPPQRKFKAKPKQQDPVEEGEPQGQDQDDQPPEPQQE